MQDWFAQNWLALLGAVTGTAALLINYLSYLHNRKKDNIDLKVDCTAHPKQAENVQALAETESKEPWDRPSMVEVYVVAVRNLGGIAAPLSRVGVVTQSGTERLALVRKGQYMQEATSGNVEALPAKSEREFTLYLKRGEELYRVTSAFAVDQTGRRWEANA